jgi:two-component system CheB/CheR fusion protein
MNDITKIAVKDLAIPLATGLQKVFKSGEELKYTSIRLKWRDETRNTVQIRIRPLPGKKRGQEAAGGGVYRRNHAAVERAGGGSRLQVYDIASGGGTAHS